MKTESKCIFLVAGRTGGPFFPLPAYSQQLDDYLPVYLEVKGGYATKILPSGNVVRLLPDVRFGALSFSNTSVLNKFIIVFGAIWSCLGVLYSMCISFYYLIQYRPRAIVSTGSFLAVPIVFASRVTNFCMVTRTKVIVHQQDPGVGLTHRLIAKYADVTSCVFQYTKSKYSAFLDADIIPNPFNTTRFDSANLSDITDNHRLLDYCKKPSSKPVFLIFGGGSGAKFINDWVAENRVELLKKFRVILLTGVLQNEKVAEHIDDDYFQTDILTQEMPFVMKKADLIMCRAGMGSISELMYLQKRAILVPIPDSHQEQNALVVNGFEIFQQKDSDKWLDMIMHTDFLYQNNVNTAIFNTGILDSYFDRIRNLLDV
jgi:UDP-N-acetylglucosamine:LPS N-acetylglucosamine transferase